MAPALPFGPAISLGEYIRRATNDFGARIVELENEIQGSFGKVKARFLERDVDGKTLHVALPTFPDDVVIGMPLIRYLCNRLQIPTDDFGFSISDDGFLPLDEEDFR